MNAFRGYIGERSELLRLVSTGVEQALFTTALGLLVAVPAVWSYNYFTDRVEGLRIEMENSSPWMNIRYGHRDGFCFAKASPELRGALANGKHICLGVSRVSSSAPVVS